MKEKVIIIGSGFGGLGAAARLAARGGRTDVDGAASVEVELPERALGHHLARGESRLPRPLAGVAETLDRREPQSLL